MTDAVFMSLYRSIHASGLSERVSVPARTRGGDLQPFLAAVDAALARARADGNAHPIVLGAMPFDPTQPSALMVPRRVRFFEREAHHADLLQTIAPVLRSHSLPDEAGYKQGVRQALAHFGLSDIRKAVLSRRLDLELAGPADARAIFSRLAGLNPVGYQFRIPLADGAELVGVSPELLARKEGSRFYSNPLAGSAPRQQERALDEAAGQALLASAKDGYEHRLVTEEIGRVLAPLCSTLHVPGQPALLQTAAMWHLSTEIDGVLANPAISALELACRLHPTPAVCGYPARAARKLIDLVEPFERDLFAGMVGWCDAEGNGEWAVTIRCGKVQGNRIQLFAGAGIVADSCPEAEWAETQAKLQTMLGALGAALPQTHPVRQAA